MVSGFRRLSCWNKCYPPVRFESHYSHTMVGISRENPFGRMAACAAAWVATCVAACAPACAAPAPVPGQSAPRIASAPRIVSLSPHITELLFAAGAGARIVGVDGASDYPPAARQIPRLGEVAALDMEGLLRLAPSSAATSPSRGICRAAGG